MHARCSVRIHGRARGSSRARQSSMAAAIPARQASTTKGQRRRERGAGRERVLCRGARGGGARQRRERWALDAALVRLDDEGSEAQGGRASCAEAREAAARGRGVSAARYKARLRGLSAYYERALQPSRRCDARCVQLSRSRLTRGPGLRPERLRCRARPSRGHSGGAPTRSSGPALTF
jgi:hypothetical protein